MSRNRFVIILSFLFLSLFYNNIAVADDDEFKEFETAIIKGSIDDPFEKYNRKIYKFNDTIDKYFFEHLARSYRKTIPKPARLSFRNFLDNMSLPLSAINSMAQGKIDNGLATFSTFLINSTLGVGGFFDVARKKGINYEREDFGQTLGYWGFSSNNFLMLPFFGPSNLRDFVGFSVDRTIDPLGFNTLQIGGDTNFIDGSKRIFNTVFKVVDNREELLDIIDNIRQDSFDPYATIRSAYLQRRLAQIEN
ncbi:MAG: VacJ family lipoprotein [Alphaproteobacteria bacterium]